MTDIHLDGIIGWGITAADVRQALKQAGDAAHLRINSPGGDVHEGIAIANAIRAYQRDGGTVKASVVGLAASMATYIAAFADELLVEDNAVYMIHNPWMMTLGDHRDMTKAANVLGSIRGVLARAYAAKTDRPLDDILAEMDEETWLYGAEIVQSGYADALIHAGDGPESQPEAMALAQSAYGAMRAKLKEREADAAQLDQIAALLPHTSAASSAPTKEAPMATSETVADEQTTANPETNSETKPEAPANSGEASETDAVQAAVVAERQRISAIQRACAAASLPDMAQTMIDEGISADAARERVINALAEQGGPEMRQAQPAGQPSAASGANWASVIEKINQSRG